MPKYVFVKISGAHRMTPARLLASSAASQELVIS